MRVNIIPCLVLGTFLFIGAKGQQCLISSEPDGSMSSDAEFWKGVSGAEFITELDDNTHAEFIKTNPKAFIMYYATCKR